MDENKFRVDASEMMLANLDLLCRKQQDYGPDNISEFGLMGVIIRMNDKMERLKHLVRNGLQPNNESVEDTMRDISNYGVIGLMLLAGKWPKGDLCGGLGIDLEQAIIDKMQVNEGRALLHGKAY